MHSRIVNTLATAASLFEEFVYPKVVILPNFPSSTPMLASDIHHLGIFLFLTLPSITATFLRLYDRFGAETVTDKPPDSFLMMEVFAFIGVDVAEACGGSLGGLYL